MNEHEPPTMITESSGSLTRAIGAGFLAAVAGGIAWALIVKVSDYEVGFVAWGIGFLVGTAVVFATGGSKGPRLQAIAVVFALLGILLGKYLGFALIVQDDAESVGASIGLFSDAMLTLFRDNLSDVFGVFDLLWIGLAVFSAWRIPQVEEPEAAATD